MTSQPNEKAYGKEKPNPKKYYWFYSYVGKRYSGIGSKLSKVAKNGVASFAGSPVFSVKQVESSLAKAEHLAEVSVSSFQPVDEQFYMMYNEGI